MSDLDNVHKKMIDDFLGAVTRDELAGMVAESKRAVFGPESETEMSLGLIPIGIRRPPTYDFEYTSLIQGVSTVSALENFDAGSAVYTSGNVFIGSCPGEFSLENWDDVIVTPDINFSYSVPLVRFAKQLDTTINRELKNAA